MKQTRLTVAAVATLAAGGAAVPQTISSRDTACTDVHIFLAKGNNEPYPGRQGKLVTAICSGLPSCDYEDIQWYNPDTSDYCVAVHEGAINGVSQITAYNKRCPDSKLVLSGYSQGAHVAGDVLGGGGGDYSGVFGCVQEGSAGLGSSSAAGKAIVAALRFGDTRHAAGQSYSVESGAKYPGVIPRTGAQLAAVNAFGGALRDYCVDTDPICAAGGPEKIVANHLNYFDIYSNAAAKWVQEKVAAAGVVVPPTSTKTTAAAPPAATTSKSSTTKEPATTPTTSSGEESSSPTSTGTGTGAAATTPTSPAETQTQGSNTAQTAPSSTPSTPGSGAASIDASGIGLRMAISLIATAAFFAIF